MLLLVLAYDIQQNTKIQWPEKSQVDRPIFF